jgi:acyl-CoA reductase-like NAD-dependent aldehyde dehydrogenase
MPMRKVTTQGRMPVADAGVPDGVVNVVTGYGEPRRSIDRPGSRWQA